MKELTNPIVIENVLQYKMRGKVAYQSHLPASVALQLTYVKPFDLTSGKGYQRPTDAKRIDDFAMYLSKGDDALFTPVLLNAGGNWEFSSYDKNRPSFGRLICRYKASLMDGQHRLGGIRRYTVETNSELTIPFMAFHFLDEDEEIKLFDTINTKAKGISSSLSKFLKRDSDELSWMATELLSRRESPFYQIGSIVGKRSKGRHITLQNLYRLLHYFIKDSGISGFTKEQKLGIVLSYFQLIREIYPNEWVNYKEYKLTHIVCLDALAISGSKIVRSLNSEKMKSIDSQGLAKAVKRLKKIDWSVDGPFKYLKGISGSKTLSLDLYDMMLPSP